MNPVRMRRLGLTALGLSLPTLAAASVLSYNDWRQFRKTSEMIATDRRAAHLNEDLLVRLEEAETGQRGFLLTGRVEYLSPYEAALRAAPADLDELSALIRGDETNAPAGGFGSNPRGPGGQAAALVGWKAWACWRAALRTTSTTCWWASWATPV